MAAHRLALVLVRGLLCSCRCGLLIAVASPVEHEALGAQASVRAAPGLHCSMECGIFRDQGSNLCHLCQQADVTAGP